MLRLGIIGTNWITHQFVEGAESLGEYTLKGVYSRDLAVASVFAEKHQKDQEEITCWDDLALFLQDDKIDVVYIASPNSLHFEQAKAALLAGKHVILEKPACSSLQEVKELFDIAEERGVYFFEAARNVYETSFQQVKAALPAQADITGAHLSYMKYSSRYDQVLAGAEPNIFSPKFAGGALMDLGIYLVYAAVDWFGEPQSACYFPQMIRTGVDGMGTGILRYDHFDVTLLTGKIADSFLPVEIYTTQGTVSLDGVQSISRKISFNRQTGTTSEERMEVFQNPMAEEAAAFALMITSGQKVAENAAFKQTKERTITVHKVMEELRKSGNIIFK